MQIKPPPPKPTRRFPARLVIAIVLTTPIALYFVLPWVGGSLNLEPVLTQVEWLRVKEIDVAVEWPLNPAGVKSWIPELQGKSILLINGTRVLSSLEQRPWVKSVSLKKNFPDRLQIQIETKKPLALAMDRGQLLFLDHEGSTIDRVTPAFLKSYDLPVISWERDMNAFSWKRREVVAMIERLRRELVTRDISQIGLGAYPFFRVFLVAPKTEVLLNWETWEMQLPRLTQLLNHPPRQLGALAKIDLTSAKKAIVSSTLSN